MRTKTNTKVQSIIDTMKLGQLEKIKETYQLTESELRFLLGIGIRYQMPSPILLQVLTTH